MWGFPPCLCAAKNLSSYGILWWRWFERCTYLTRCLCLSLYNCQRPVMVMWRWWCEGGMDGLPRDVEPVQSTHLQSSCQPPSNQICCLPKTHHMFGQFTIWNLDKYNLQFGQFTIYNPVKQPAGLQPDLVSKIWPHVTGFSEITPCSILIHFSTQWVNCENSWTWGHKISSTLAQCESRCQSAVIVGGQDCW